jgi:TRAP transporter 4TM/12TM fusion protein
MGTFQKLYTETGHWIAFVFALLAVYTAGPFILFNEGITRGGAMAFGVVVILMHNPLALRHKNAPAWARGILWGIDLFLLVGFLFAVKTFFEIYDSFWDGIFILETRELLIGLFGTAVILEMIRRIYGPVLPIVCTLAFLYAMFGGDLPGILGHSGFSCEETTTAVWYSFDGVFGRPTGIVSTVVLVFVVFGAILQSTGAGAILLKIAVSLTARIRGGTAHSAIAASALFGTISGSPVANVVGTGVFTIPMIKKQGFTNHFAGAVEAAASAAGQFTPPIMGAVAFLMAELVGKRYIIVATAAALPAFLFFCSLFANVYFEAVRQGIKHEKTGPKLTLTDWLLSARFITPLVVVVVVLLQGWSAAMAGFWAVVSALIIGAILDAEFRRDPRKLIKALKNGGRACGQVIIALGSIGIVIAVVKLTGVGLNFASMVVALSQGSLFLALILTMLACLALGMGLPTIPAYLIIVLILGPAISKLGVPMILTHMFVLYFGVLSNVTPPVAIAAYAAAPIAGANPMRTGYQAIKLATVGFLIPFVLIYNPSISLVVGFEWSSFIWIMLRLPVLIWLVASSLVGVDREPLSFIERVMRFLVGVATLSTVFPIQAGTFVLGLAIIVFHRLRKR